MMDTKSISAKSTTASDAVIDGLVAGVISGVVMLAFILIVEIVVSDVSPSQTLSWFVPERSQPPLFGGLIHIAISAIYGMVFGWIWNLVRDHLPWRVPAWLLGLIYSMAIFIFGIWVILPGINSALLVIPSWLFGFAHAVYGLLLGWLVGRK